jgi:hypothetical protein
VSRWSARYSLSCMTIVDTGPKTDAASIAEAEKHLGKKDD